MTRRSAAIVALALALIWPLTPSTAGAAAAATLTGSGTIHPGYVGSPTPQTSFTFTGTATGGFLLGTLNTVGSCTFSFTGDSRGYGETIASGAGGGSATCNGYGIAASATLTYARTGQVLTVAGPATVTGVACSMSGRFIMTPTNLNPYTSYQLAGTLDCL